MAGFDLSDVLAAARGIPGAREDGRWRCVVYLSAYDWMSGWLRVPDMAAQSAACKAWLSAHGDARKAETIRNRNAVRNVRAAFDELMRVIENRRADCVVVPDIAVFAPTSLLPFGADRLLDADGEKERAALLCALEEHRLDDVDRALLRRIVEKVLVHEGQRLEVVMR